MQRLPQVADALLLLLLCGKSKQQRCQSHSLEYSTLHTMYRPSPIKMEITRNT